MAKVRPPIRRTDGNQAQVMAWLRDLGCTVIDLHTLGKDIPDLLVGIGDANVLVEVKTADGELSAGQKRFFEEWKGPKAVARTVEDCVQIARSNFLT